jgi:hypothetical protein
MSLEELSTRLEGAVTSVLMQARMDKSINESALVATKEILSAARVALEGSESIPRSLAGHGFLLFIGLLAEAEHARDDIRKNRLLDVAWDIEEHLRKIFGPQL